jgi:hypothetical protein
MKSMKDCFARWLNRALIAAGILLGLRGVA